MRGLRCLGVWVFGCLAGGATAGNFEVAALVDSLDFAKEYDIESSTGNVQVLEHVLLTHATDVWWRDKGGGNLRYPSRAESYPLAEYPFDRHIVPNEDMYGHLRLNKERANAFPLIRRECERRGLGFGIHTTWEETHNLISLTSNWTLDHPQYWCRIKGRKPFLGTCALSHPEVLEHKLAMVDERLAMKPGVIFLDLYRRGSWSVERECVKPAKEEWERRYRCAVPDGHDPRWTAMIGERVTDYLKRFAAKCRAANCRFVLGSYWVDEKDSKGLYDRFGIDWRKLAADGTIDAFAVMGFEYDWKDPWPSIERVYRATMAQRGKADVYFHLSHYNWNSQSGYPGVAKKAKVGEAEAARRLLKLAKDVGARGVVLECVDYGNYSPAVCDAIGGCLKE